MCFSHRVLAVFLCAGLVTACSTTSYNSRSSVVQVVVQDLSDPTHLRKETIKVSRLGYTPVHRAVERDPYEIFELAENGMDLDATTSEGFTPLHLAVLKNPEAIIPLLLAGADPLVGTPDSILCAFSRRKNTRVDAGAKAEQIANACSEVAWGEFKLYYKLYPQWLEVHQSGLPKRYRAFIQKNSNNWFGRVATLELDEVAHLYDLKQRSSVVGCLAPLDGWYVTAGQCENAARFLEGEGVVETKEGIRLEGQFSAGLMTYGKMLYQDERLFQGEFVAGRPHGDGICWYEGKPEQCAYFEGERVDQLFKQREEWALHLVQLRRARADLVRSQAAHSSPSVLSVFSDDPNERKAAQLKLLVKFFNYLAKRRSR